MFPFFYLFGKEVSAYWMMGVIGFLFAITVSLIRCKRNHGDVINQLYFLTFCMLGMLAGAKILAWLTGLPYILANLSQIFQSYDSFLTFLGSGFVFYGGLFGVFGGCIVYRWYFHENVIPYMQSSVICIPIFHFWGRIGCFLMGCCHGKISETWGIPYTNAPYTPNGVPYIPVQLAESVGNLVILVLLLLYERKPRRELSNAGVYLLCYGILRFGLEFLRGDAARGKFLIFSTSQWISFITIAAGITLIWGKERKLLQVFRIKNCEIL